MAKHCLHLCKHPATLTFLPLSIKPQQCEPTVLALCQTDRTQHGHALLPPPTLRHRYVMARLAFIGCEMGWIWRWGPVKGKDGCWATRGHWANVFQREGWRSEIAWIQPGGFYCISSLILFVENVCLT